MTLADEWRDLALEPSAQVLLAFAVQAGNFSGVLRLLAIPRLVGNVYSIFDMVDSQQRTAAHRSDIFKTVQARRMTHPSPISAVLIQTARKAGSGAGGSSDVNPVQIMRFDLSGIDIGVFNEDDDGRVADFYRFVLGRFEADLKRQATHQDRPERDLRLMLSSIRWDTSDGARAAGREKREMTARQLIDVASASGRREVASLPSMVSLFRT